MHFKLFLENEERKLNAIKECLNIHFQFLPSYIRSFYWAIEKGLFVSQHNFKSSIIEMGKNLEQCVKNILKEVDLNKNFLIIEHILDSLKIKIRNIDTKFYFLDNKNLDDLFKEIELFNKLYSLLAVKDNKLYKYLPDNVTNCALNKVLEKKLDWRPDETVPEDYYAL